MPGGQSKQRRSRSKKAWNAKPGNDQQDAAAHVRRFPVSAPIILAVVVILGGVFFFYSSGDDGSPGGSEAQPPALFLSGADVGYVDPVVCQGCHEQIWETYQRTGMGRSFYRPRPENTVEDYREQNTYYHEASDRHYTMIERGGKYYQRRHQVGFDGQETNVVEKEIHYVMGSGNHTRTYLHKTAAGKIIQLPLAWYPERGGAWAMNPGYDRPDHQGFQRTVAYDCMGCHNGYPEVEAGGDLPGRPPLYPGRVPEGIDCQRCHGPGREHVELFEDQDPPIERVRASIVNPARLSAERQMDVCMQCHLETTSRKLPNVVHRWERGLFSFRPGEPLAASVLHFDHQPGTGRDGKFQINHAAYRLRKSACFEQSGGEMTCTTCHDPHDVPRGDEARRHYTGVCRECHSAEFDGLVAAGRHTSDGGCLRCHMPKRRTEDVVHAVMTDHYIQRRKPGRDLLAPLKEDNDGSYEGEVVLYEQAAGEVADESGELYVAVAQVQQDSNRESGVPRLERAIEKYRPEPAEFYFELAEAFARGGRFAEAVPVYDEALRRRPEYVLARQRLGVALTAAGDFSRAEKELARAREVAPSDAFVARDLGSLYIRQERFGEALEAVKAALQLDPDLPELHNNRGSVLVNLGRPVEAKAAYVEAVRLQPDLAEARANLAQILVGEGQMEEAEYHFEAAIGSDPGYVAARFGYAVALAKQERWEPAGLQLEAALAAQPDLPEAHTLLGNILEMRGRVDEAIGHYERAVESSPGSVEAHLNLGSALAAQGRLAEARVHLTRVVELRPDHDDAHLGLGQILIAEGRGQDAVPHLRRAVESSDREVSESARELLDRVGARVE